jgi:hypothetical protein
MEDINTTSSATVTIERKILQPSLIIQALAFTAILYFSVGQTPPDTSKQIAPSVSFRANLSESVSNTVLQHASQQAGVPKSALQIIQAQPQIWADNCLELRESGVSCTQMPVPGWQITVASKQQRWIFRTDVSGSAIKLESGAALPNQNGNQAAIAFAS